MKTHTLGEIFTPREIRRAQKLYNSTNRENFAERCAAEVVEPALTRINATTGQENNSKYLAYVLLHALMTCEKTGASF